MIAISIVSDKTEDIYNRKTLAQIEVYAQTLENAQKLANALKFVFHNNFDDGVYKEISTIRDMQGLGPQNWFRIDLDVRFHFKDMS